MGLPKLSKSKILLQAANNFKSGDLGTYFQEHNNNQEHLSFVKQRLQFLRQNLVRASNRGSATKVIQVDADYCFSIGEQQGWRCALTGNDLEFKRGGTNWGGKWCNPKSCTIDRIDSNLGYIEGNIQLVTWEVNCIKQHFDNGDFIELCKKVATHHK